MSRIPYPKAFVAVCAIAIAAVFLCFDRGAIIYSVSADSASDLQAKIDSLQKEISQYSTLLDSTSKQAQTLANALKTLQLTQSKLEASLSLTTKNISKTTLTIQQLSKSIADTEAKIASTSAAIAVGIRDTETAESQSALENFLNNRSISDTWDYVNAVQSLQVRVKNKLDDLQSLGADLHAQQDQATGEQKKLAAYQKNLSDQKQAALAATQEKTKLLADTNGREATYSKILAQKVAQERTYEQELFTYESQLKVTINPGTIPSPRPGILSWPLASIRITQYFGKTVDAKRLYVSGTHGGVDFGASIGTPVKAALSGTVADTEPTKYRAGCQYGKYVLINHPNGLSTIYGHLSVVSVKPGDTVITGDTVGYSGDTGYATGPHLHLGLYVTSGIRVVDSSALGSTNCAGIKTVAAPPAAYLDPMAYLPSL